MWESRTIIHSPIRWRDRRHHITQLFDFAGKLWWRKTAFACYYWLRLIQRYDEHFYLMIDE